MTQNSNTDEILALYRRIMAELEPDLLPENIHGIAQKYTGESAEDTANRKARYEAAFVECFARIDAVLAQMKQDVYAFKAQILDLCRAKEQEAAPGILLSLEDSISES